MLSSDNHDLFSLSGYVCFSFPRLCKIGGGVAIFVKQFWNAHVIDYKNNVINFEFGVVKASNSCTGESYIVAGIYRPPKGSIINFIDELSLFYDNLTDMSAQINKCTLILAGDYNINVLRTGINMLATQFIDYSYSYGLFPTISLPTRISMHTSSLIGKIFVDPFWTNTSRYL